MDSNMTLRVVGGLHEGAQLDLASGKYVVGSAADCDIVLHDEGVAPAHVEIHVAGATVKLSSIANAAASCRGRRLGSGVLRLRESDVVTIGAAAFCVQTAANPAQAPKSSAPQQPDRVKPGLLGRAFAPYALLGVLAVGTVFVYAEVVGSGQSTESRAQNGLALARQAIRSAHLDEITVGLTSGGRLSATGYVRTVQDAQRLAAEPSLSALGAPVLRYHVAQEIVSRVKQHLDPAAVEVTYVGQGKIAVSGRGDAGLRERMRRLSRDLDGVATVEDQLAYGGARLVLPAQALKLPIRIVAVQSGEPSYFEDQHGARYFVGGSLSDGAQVAAIEDGQILFNKNGKTMRYALDQHGGDVNVFSQ